MENIAEAVQKENTDLSAEDAEEYYYYEGQSHTLACLKKWRFGLKEIVASVLEWGLLSKRPSQPPSSLLMSKRAF